MIHLREDFVSIKNYPGYFWSVTEQQLYTLKVSGVLRPMKPHKGWKSYYTCVPPGYQVSKDGRRRHLALSDLKELHLSPSFIYEPYPMAPCEHTDE
jgi:hypothetical protein